MKQFFTGLMVIVLVGCTQVPPVEPRPVYRDTTAQIASQTNVGADRMAGTWHVRQTFNSGGDSLGIQPVFAAEPNGDLLQTNIAKPVETAGRGVVHQTVPMRFQATGPGRWAAVEPLRDGAGMDLWVMWMDFDSRTVALGTPSGEFGWILDKSATGGEDRIEAARDIMEWFGYDLTKLTRVSR